MGSKVSMDELIDRHAESLYRVAYRLSGQPADAEDLIQQTFLVAQEKLDQLRDVDTAAGWLVTILRNLFLKQCRDRVKLVSLTDLADAPETQPDNLETSRDDLQAALLALPEEYRLVLVLFYFRELSYKDIAQSLGIPLGTVMSRLARAKAQLKRHLEGSGTLTGMKSGAGH
jgi:RNA polymerase sigma-70 factor, ECF subfamily